MTNSKFHMITLSHNNLTFYVKIINDLFIDGSLIVVSLHLEN
jgi:hypothetical protein